MEKLLFVDEVFVEGFDDEHEVFGGESVLLCEGVFFVGEEVLSLAHQFIQEHHPGTFVCGSGVEHSPHVHDGDAFDLLPIDFYDRLH